MEPFLDDGHKQVYRDRDPELRLHRVLGGTEEALDSQMLLDPLEEQLHLPALPIQRADGPRRQAEVVGQKHQSFAGLVREADAPQMCRVPVAGVQPVERDGLIAAHTGLAVGRRGVEPSGIEIRLRPDDEECSRLVQGIEAIEVGVPPVHHIESSGLGDQEVEHIDLVQLAVRNMDKARNTAPQIEQRVQPNRCLGRTEVRPGKHRQAQIDGGGIQRVDRVRELYAQGIPGVERLRLRDQALGEFGVHAPVARFVGIGEGGATDRLAKAHVVELGRLRREAHLDVAQALAIGQLGEGHATQLLGARQRAYAVIAAVTGHNAMKGLPRQEVHDLREQGLANVHASLRSSQSRKAGRTGQRHSSRRQYGMSRKPCRDRGYQTSGHS